MWQYFGLHLQPLRLNLTTSEKVNCSKKINAGLLSQELLFTPPFFLYLSFNKALKILSSKWLSTWRNSQFWHTDCKFPCLKSQLWTQGETLFSPLCSFIIHSFPRQRKILADVGSWAEAFHKAPKCVSNFLGLPVIPQWFSRKLVV